MEVAGSNLNLVILDACRNNPFGGRGLRDLGQGLAVMRAPRGTLISYATQPGNVAMDGTTGHSPYTAALAEALRRPGLPVLDVFNEVGLTVDQARWASAALGVEFAPGGRLLFSRCDDGEHNACCPHDSFAGGRGRILAEHRAKQQRCRL